MRYWQKIGTTTASTCGHEIEIQDAVSDAGEYVTRVDGYPDPDREDFDYMATELCLACYEQKMQKHAMSFDQMVTAFGGKARR